MTRWTKFACDSEPRLAAHALWACTFLIACGNGSGTSGAAEGASGAMGVAGSTSSAAGANGTSGSGNTGQGGSATNPPPGGGGAMSMGGAGTAGGSAGNGGASTTPDTPDSTRVRTVIPFDDDWLFNKGDASGADQSAFADGAWRALSVPHDWSIEGPFDANAPATGRGGYLPTGIAWYRKHFTLPQAAAGRRVFLEFDGVMANSDVYVNGTHIGHHPFGYSSFRYDVTDSIKPGPAENVVAVKTDTSVQPASRYYAGAGIYRHVRLLATDPVHVAQYGTFVTTPAPSATSATVHVVTTVTNSGTSSQMVGLEGIVTDPSGAALPAVNAAAQSIAAGASVSFTFDVGVTNPKLWDLTAPNLYKLTTHVLVGGAPVDDDVTVFGIRELKFDNGMTLNGKSIKFQGVAIHQDYHGLGVAAPERAVQRRLAQLKALGVNAIRTAHEPPSPDMLELTDRMGLLVLDEFSDVWTGHKYADVGDYSASFNKAATSPTGMPPVPGVASGATWSQVDLTGIIMRDRNHASVALYSLGNEIHESIGTRTPILTKLLAISHALDPSRKDTQALLQPGTAGDVGGTTNSLLDVWGDNYHVDDCLAAIPGSPSKSGLLTEMGTEVSTWTTVMANPGLTGEFLWTGVDYLGEADGAWPRVGSNAGIMDAMGTVRSIGYSWQKIWGAAQTSAPATGTNASQVVLTADQPSVLTDPKDVVFFAAAISDSARHLVSSSNAAVTFTISGPGKILAVDSGSMTQESFRGLKRNAYNGLAYAIVQATGAGAITVTASAAGLTAGSAMVQGTTGTFIPCSGACN